MNDTTNGVSSLTLPAMPIGGFKSSNEVAELYGITRARVLQLKAQFEIKGTRIGRDWFFSPEEVARMKDRQKPGRPRKPPKGKPGLRTKPKA